MINFLTISAGGLVPCDGGKADPCTIQKLFEMLQTIMQWMLLYGGIIAALFIAVGGIMMLLARGNEQKVTQAKLWITNAVIGILLVFCAWLIINTVMWFFGRPVWNILDFSNKI